MRSILFFDYNPIPLVLGANKTQQRAAVAKFNKEATARAAKEMPKAQFSEADMLRSNAAVKQGNPCKEVVDRLYSDGWVAWTINDPWPFGAQDKAYFMGTDHSQQSLGCYSHLQLQKGFPKRGKFICKIKKA